MENRAPDFDGVFYCMKYFSRNMPKNGYGCVSSTSILGCRSCKGGVSNMTRHAAE